MSFIFARQHRFFRYALIATLLFMLSSCALFAGKSRNHLQVKLNLELREEAPKSIKKATKAMAKGRLDKATQRLNSALSKNFNSSALQMLNGLNYHLRALNGATVFFDLAEQGYLTAVRADKSNWDARFYLGLLYVDMRRYTEAKAQLGAYVLNNDKDPEGLYYLALASYYSGDVEAAHAASNRLWEISTDLEESPIHPEALLSMLTIVNASADKPDEAENYLDQYILASKSENFAEQLKRRLEDWRSIYDQDEATSESTDEYGSQDGYQEDSYQDGGYDEYGASGGDDYQSEDEFVDNKMVAVDVVIVRTEEDISTATGVNLLSQLQFQFGNVQAGLPAYSKGNNRIDDRLDPLSERPELDFANGDVFDPRLHVNQETITKLITVPAVNYNLNILNANDGLNEILARPTLVARAGQTSEFFSGVEVSAAAVSGGAGDSVSIEKEIGVKLSVTPEFGPDGTIIMQVQAERTFLTTPSRSVVFEFRLDTTKTTVNANVAMKYGQTLILGGLNERETENNVDGVPILRDIPIINLLFSRKTTRDFKKSVMILLTPRPASYLYADPSDAKTMESAMNNKVNSQLQNRYGNWFQPMPNIRAVISELKKGQLYKNFQQGDLVRNTWYKSRSHSARVNRVIERHGI